MCRYILATPPNAADTNHNVRVIFGNGLRPQIWPQFINRFKIPKVAEFYGATEGNANIGENFYFIFSFTKYKKIVDFDPILINQINFDCVILNFTMF